MLTIILNHIIPFLVGVVSLYFGILNKVQGKKNNKFIKFMIPIGIVVLVLTIASFISEINLLF